MRRHKALSCSMVLLVYIHIQSALGPVWVSLVITWALAPPGLIWSPLDSQSLTLTHLLISNLCKANNHYKSTHMLHTGTYVTRGNVFLFDTSAVLVIRHDLPYNLLQAVQDQRPYAQTAMHISCWHLQLICNIMRIYIYIYIHIYR